MSVVDGGDFLNRQLNVVNNVITLFKVMYPVSGDHAHILGVCQGHIGSGVIQRAVGAMITELDKKSVAPKNIFEQGELTAGLFGGARHQMTIQETVLSCAGQTDESLGMRRDGF